jgi:hypothetical protein
MTVRSQVLIQTQLTATYTSSTFTCPAGYIVLVKSAALYNGSGGTANAYLAIRAASGSPYMNFVSQSVPALGTTMWSGWFVLNPGDQLSAAASAYPMDMWVSGAILAGPPQFPAAT